MSEEEWRKIAGFENYSVSNLGRVRRDTYGKQGSRAKPGLILKPEAGTYGHLRVRLFKDGRYYPSLVHRLVATAFDLERRPDQTQVAHNDGNPGNNHISNLRWATVKENMADKVLHGTVQRGERGGMNKFTGIKEDDVREIRRMRDEGIPYSEITRLLGVKRVTACAIWKRRIWKHVA